MYPTAQTSRFASPSAVSSSSSCSLDAEGVSHASAAEREFLAAILDYKQASGRMFPTWSEVLEVAQKLGYVKRTAARV